MIDPTLPDQDRAPLSNSLLRQFAGLWIVFCGLFAYLSYSRERFITALVFAVVGLAFGPVGLIVPRFIRPLFVLLKAVTTPIGWVVSHVFLGVLYYGIFTPFSLLFRLVRRDVLLSPRWLEACAREGDYRAELSRRPE